MVAVLEMKTLIEKIVDYKNKHFEIFGCTPPVICLPPLLNKFTLEEVKEFQECCLIAGDNVYIFGMRVITVED